MDKIKSIGELAEIRRQLREKGKRVVFTNGCFDILHGGHIFLFREAKKKGDVLIVAVNDDSSVQKIKGPQRPIFTEDERLEASFRRIWELKEKVFTSEKSPGQPAWSWQELNRELAPRCLTEMGAKGVALESFRREPFSILYYGERPKTFLDGIGSSSAQEMAWTSDLKIPEITNVLFALNPPSMKPAEHFGLPVSFLEALRELTTKRQVVLYLFGNPYLLRQLSPDLFQTVVCAFQPLMAFQEAAAAQFLGKIRAEGELSIDLDHG